MRKKARIFLLYLTSPDVRMDPEVARQFDPSQGLQALNRLDWVNNPMLATALQESVLDSTAYTGCTLTGSVSVHMTKSE